MCGWRPCQKESSVTALDGRGVEPIVQKQFAQRGSRRCEAATCTVSVNSLLQQERRYDRWAGPGAVGLAAVSEEPLGDLVSTCVTGRR